MLHYFFISLGGSSEMQQPEIEFLATDKFAITQTGSRVLKGLQVSWKVRAGTYQSGKKTQSYSVKQFKLKMQVLYISMFRTIRCHLPERARRCGRSRWALIYGDLRQTIRLGS